jgi:diguanylate cyclase (GGDEF)-like protein/PAS domain S-box-containing protein
LSPLTLSATLLGIFTTVYAVSATVLYWSFCRLERHAVTQRTHQVTHLLANNLERLDTTTIGNADWDETYAFVMGDNEAYREYTLTEGFFQTLELNLIALVDSSQQVVFGHSYDLVAEELQPLPEALEQQIYLHPVLARPPHESSRLVGLLMTPEVPLLLASRPVLTNEMEGSIQGSLIMGRYLDRDALTHLENLTQTDLALYPWLAHQHPADVQQAHEYLTEQSADGSEAIFLHRLNQQQVAGYVLLRDINQRPVLILRVLLPRWVYHQGLLSLGALTMVGAIATLFSVVLTWYLLRKLLRYNQERDRIYQELLQEEELAQVTLQSISEGVITIDADGRIKGLNPVAEALTGWSAAAARGIPLSKVVKLIDETNREPLTEQLIQALQAGDTSLSQAHHSLLVTREGTEVAVDESIAQIRSQDGSITGAVLVLRNADQTRSMTRELSWRATTDALTGLMNRREFESVLAQAITQARNQGEEHILCFLDLDRFKIVNDTCGHIAGDELLRQVSMVLQQTVRKTDTIARLGGDEFALLLHQCPIGQACALAETICQSIAEFRFVWEDNFFEIGVSIGLISIVRKHVAMAGVSPEQEVQNILAMADAACYYAKQAGRGQIHVYQPGEEAHLPQQQSLSPRHIEAAFREGKFCLYHQLIAPLRKPHPFDALHEVLLRLIDNEGNVVTPGGFLPSAERYNLMAKLDRWVVQALLSELADLRQGLSASTQIYMVNLSAASIHNPDFLDFVQAELAAYQIPARAICFEIPESVAIANLTGTLHLIRHLRQLGCRIALDNFRGGMTSFTYLKHLPVDFLKIDGQLSQGITQDETARIIVASIQQIAEHLGIHTIATFVTDTPLKTELTTLGFDYAQGFSIAAPRPLLSRAIAL